METTFKPGWLREQLEKAKNDVNAWPEWMKNAWNHNEAKE
jgi:hypothetical protein